MMGVRGEMGGGSRVGIRHELQRRNLYAAY
jgi:hypothetical protein